MPEDLGGLGLNLAELGDEQRRMARYSPATALSTGMHHYWVGLASDLRRLGRPEANPIIGYVLDGEILASGHAEVGNDIPVALSTTSARRVEGGWRITGRKMFGSLGPHWDRLGFHAMNTGDATGPVVVHGFVPRDVAGLTTVANWDAQGMRATESHDTVLEDVFVADADVLCVVAAGPPTHPAVAMMLVWALTLIANVYVGIAERALEIAVEQAAQRTSIAIPRRTVAHHPLVQHQVADMYLALDAAALERRRGRPGLGRPDRPRGDVGAEGAGGQVAGHGGRQPGRGPGLRGRRRLVVPPRHGTGAAVTRCASGTNPSWYRRVHPRDPRKGAARRGRGRAPLVTLSRPGRRPRRHGPPGCGCALRA